MPLAFRKLSNKRLWDTVDPSETEWLRDELRADALKDLRTSSDRLSIFLLPNDSPIVMSRVISAVCAGGDSLDKCDYALFDLEILARVGVAIEDVRGNTLDDEVNTWHRDLVRLTANQLALLGNAVRRSARFQRMLPRDVKNAIQSAISNGRIEYGRLKQTFAKHFSPQQMEGNT